MMRTHRYAKRAHYFGGSLRIGSKVSDVRAILHGPRIQPKLKVGATNDPAEAEADRVADEVMRMPEPETDFGSPAISSEADATQVRRLCVDCEEELARKPVDEMIRRQEDDEEELVQAKEALGETPASQEPKTCPVVFPTRTTGSWLILRTRRRSRPRSTVALGTTC